MKAVVAVALLAALCVVAVDAKYSCNGCEWEDVEVCKSKKCNPVRVRSKSCKNCGSYRYYDPACSGWDEKFYETWEIWPQGPRRFLNVTAAAQNARAARWVDLYYDHWMDTDNCDFTKWSALSGCLDDHKKTNTWYFKFKAAYYCRPRVPGGIPWMEYRVISIYMDLWDVGLLKNFRLAWWRKIPEWGWTP